MNEQDILSPVEQAYRAMKRARHDGGHDPSEEVWRAMTNIISHHYKGVGSSATSTLCANDIYRFLVILHNLTKETSPSK